MFLQCQHAIAGLREYVCFVVSLKYSYVYILCMLMVILVEFENKYLLPIQLARRTLARHKYDATTGPSLPQISASVSDFVTGKMLWASALTRRPRQVFVPPDRWAVPRRDRLWFVDYRVRS